MTVSDSRKSELIMGMGHSLVTSGAVATLLRPVNLARMLASVLAIMLVMPAKAQTQTPAPAQSPASAQSPV